MTGDSTKTMAPEPRTFTVGTFRPADAPGIGELFRAVYGEGYPIRLFYDTEALTAANAEGQYYSIVARGTQREVVGVQHLFRSAPYASLYEGGAGLVLKEYRKGGINAEMLRFMFEEFVPSMPSIEETFGESVCYHPYMQKSMEEDFRHVATALEVALMPAQTYGKEKPTAGRVATLDAFRCYNPKPHRIYLPVVYEDSLRRIYARLDDTREIALSEADLPAGTPSQIETSLFTFAQVARLAVPASGSDFAARFAEQEDNARAKKSIVLQVWLNLTEPWVGRAAELLRRRGYFFGGALPRWFDGDGLLMQKLLCPPAFEDIILSSEASQKLLEVIKEDWQRAQQE
ncbi:MAG: hypothetical protein M0009_16435 [Deltaproteobacteria bacterium]|nr:hypothetical protein [Deltaproteobacteria bacterium]